MLRFTRFVLSFAMILILAASCKPDPKVKGDPDLFQLLFVKANGTTLSTSSTRTDVPVSPEFVIEFTAPMDTTSAKAAITLDHSVTNSPAALHFRFESDQRLARITVQSPLSYKTGYNLVLTDALKGADKQPFPGVTYAIETMNGTMSLVSATVGSTSLMGSATPRNIPYQGTDITLTFSQALDAATFSSFFNLTPTLAFDRILSADRKTVTLRNTNPLRTYTRYQLSVPSTLRSDNGFTFPGFSKAFISGLDPNPKFPILSDDELMTLVQSQTFKYFWDFGHPVSGLARERNSSGETVTIGGSGFGVMGIVVGIHRGFVTRDAGIARLTKIVDFLEDADRFHGVWPHWMNGSTGARIAFSQFDNGGDLVETSFMAQGLLTVRQYMNPAVEAEQALITKINGLLSTIEWDWHRRNGQNTLYWHWSPEHEWRMNMQVRGYNEALITYFMAATSTTHGIPKIVYDNGWAQNGNIRNGRSFYGITLPVGFDFGGPLFFAHYSFLGLDPRGLRDAYADYWVQNRNHSLIHYEHGVRNPQGHVGYSADSWGLTASDDPNGYTVHEPSRDNGTITPTAALSSIPFTPTESMAAMRNFYHILGDRLWGPYGFYDAFNPNVGWWATSTLAIDQGPILVMIENHRSGLLWDLFMSAPEVDAAMTILGFTSTSSSKINP